MLPSLIFDKSNLLREICKSWEQPPVYFGTKRRWQSVWKLENFINLSLFRYLNVLELTSRHLTVTNNFGSWALVVQPLPATSYMPLAQMLKIRGNKNTHQLNGTFEIIAHQNKLRNVCLCNKILDSKTWGTLIVKHYKHILLRCFQVAAGWNFCIRNLPLLGIAVYFIVCESLS